MNQDTSGLYKSISSLGNAIALGAAVIGTPTAFDLTKDFLFAYFYRLWDSEIAAILVLVMAGIEAYVIYAATSFLFTAAVIWIITTLAVRRFKE